MKKTMLIVMAALFGLGGMAQETEADTSYIHIGDMKLQVIENNDSTSVEFEEESRIGDKDALTYWSGIDLGVNMFVDADGNTSLSGDEEWLSTNPAKSLHWSFNIFEQKIKLVKNHVGITTGLGLTYNSYGLDDNVRITNVNDSTAGFILDRNTPDSLGGFTAFTKNKLRATYVRVPVLLEFNTSEDPDRTFHLAAGVVAGLKIGSINKVHFEEGGSKVRQRTANDFNMNQFMLDATVRLGYRDFTLFANYGLTPLFEDGKGPEVYPLTFGISLVAG